MLREKWCLVELYVAKVYIHVYVGYIANERVYGITLVHILTALFWSIKSLYSHEWLMFKGVTVSLIILFYLLFRNRTFTSIL